MSKRNYGIPYMGSKNRIAKQIIDFLPSGETLVDLFGGGGAITDCASESGKWKNVIYNELDVLPYTCFLKALKGEYENETRWISREDFLRLKDTDEYVACCFSFGNNFKTYMYNEKIEPYKRAYHYAIVLNDFQPLSELFDKETVDMLKKSVEGETNKKQRRLKFTRVLGNYIIGLSKEAEGIDTIRKTVEIDNNVRSVLQNQERNERLDTLKKTMNITDDNNVRNLLETQERNERIDLLKKTMMVKQEGRNGNNNVLQNQQRKETIDNLKKTMVVKQEGRNGNSSVLETQQCKERTDTLKKTVQIINGKFPGQSLQSQERNERIQEMQKEQVDNITFFNDDYRNVELPANAIIYCDIPYRNTGTYNKAEEFDYDAFYDWCVEKKKQGYQVFISEYSMPEDRFECVKELSKLSSLAPTKSIRVTEKIFVPK